jgi:hypothetical protein
MTSLSSNIRARNFDLTTAKAKLAIAETSEIVDTRFADNETKARETARAYRALSQFNEQIFEFSVAEPSAGIVALYRASQGLAMIAEPLRHAFQSFDHTFGNLIENDVRTKIQRLCDLAAGAAEKLSPLWLSTVETFRRDFEVGIEEELATAEEWSSVDGDGLDDDYDGADAPVLEPLNPTESAG